MRNALIFVGALVLAPTFAVANDHQDRARESSVKQMLETQIPAHEPAEVGSEGEAESAPLPESAGVDQQTEEALDRRAERMGGMATQSE